MPIYDVRRQVEINALCHRVATSRDVSMPGTAVEDEGFRIIYRFPYIVQARLVCRVKLFQTGVTLVVLPVTAVLAAMDIIDVGLFWTTVNIATLACAMLYVMGSFFRSFVGIIYLNGKSDMLKVAHLTFWGGRRDILMPVDDVVPFADRNENPLNIYFTLKRYSTPKEKYYYILRFGGIVNHELFESVLGSHQ